LFGLTVTDYPGLMKIKRELNLLQKLYGLYNDVIDTVNGYYDIMWTDVDIEKINQELLEFQNRYDVASRWKGSRFMWLLSSCH
jgi:dynein heavy chain